MQCTIAKPIDSQPGNPLTVDYPLGENGDNSGGNSSQTAHGINETGLIPFPRRCLFLIDTLVALAHPIELGENREGGRMWPATFGMPVAWPHPGEV